MHFMKKLKIHPGYTVFKWYVGPYFAVCCQYIQKYWVSSKSNKNAECATQNYIYMQISSFRNPLVFSINWRQKCADTGNAEADTIAKRALKSVSIPVNYKHHFIEIPKLITQISSMMTHTIDLKIYKVLREAKASQNAGPSQDDFSSSDTQQISLSSATS